MASGDTTGLALDDAALIALVTPGAVTKAAGSSAGSVDLSFSAASTAFDYLAKGEVLTLTYTVSIDDGDGGVTPQTFVVTVTGTDDAPVIADIAQQNLTEQTDTSPLTATIPVTFTDVDLTDVGHAADIAGVVASGDTTGLALDDAALIVLVTPGTVTKASGSSSGSVDLDFSAASSAFDYLAAGEQLTLTYTVAIDDGHGGVTPQTFVVTVTGTNDAPVFTGSDLAATYDASGSPVAIVRRCHGKRRRQRKLRWRIADGDSHDRRARGRHALDREQPAHRAERHGRNVRRGRGRTWWRRARSEHSRTTIPTA